MDASPSEKEWLGNVNRLQDLVLGDDPREFLRWDVILKTMSVTYAGYVTHELEYLQGLSAWESQWRQAIEESPVGHPIPHWQYPQSSGNLIHHAYHIAQFEDKCGVPVNRMNFVLEFGGGYGSLCRLIYNLGFAGRYIIFDLPAFSALQAFYLKSLGLHVHSFDSFAEQTSGILCISDFDSLSRAVAKCVDASPSMFIATWSLSETPMKLRNSLLPLISSFDSFLIAYQDQFNEINNIDFFKRWKEGYSKVKWQDWKLEHLPNHNRYLFGMRDWDRKISGDCEARPF